MGMLVGSSPFGRGPAGAAHFNSILQHAQALALLRLRAPQAIPFGARQFQGCANHSMNV